jgi:adenylate cyclase
MSAPFSLRAHRDCMEGVMPAVIATVAADGTPNVTYLSKVMFVDDQHVAISNQFFSKTVRNLSENPHAQLTLLRPANGQQLRLDVTHVRTETQGELFEQMRAEIDAIASLMEMQDVFRLRAVDVFRVTRGELLRSMLDG